MAGHHGAERLEEGVLVEVRSGDRLPVGDADYQRREDGGEGGPDRCLGIGLFHLTSDAKQDACEEVAEFIAID